MTCSEFPWLYFCLIYPRRGAGRASDQKCQQEKTRRAPRKACCIQTQDQKKGEPSKKESFQTTTALTSQSETAAPSPWQQRLSGKCGLHAHLIVNRYPSPLFGVVSEKTPWESGTFIPTWWKRTPTSLPSTVSGEATWRAVRKCLSPPSRVVSVEACWGVKSYFNQAVLTRHHFPSTPIPAPSPMLVKAKWGTWIFIFFAICLCAQECMLGVINIHGEDTDTSLASLW